MELLEGHIWQDPSAASVSSLCVNAPAFAPAALMSIRVMDLQGKMVDPEKVQEIKQAGTPDGLLVGLENKRDRLEKAEP